MGKTLETAGPLRLVLDTDIFIDLLRGFPAAIDFVRERADEISFSAITEAELLSGNRCADPRGRKEVIHLLSRFAKIPVDNPLVQVAGDLRRVYKLETGDAIIAASAIAIDGLLITRNMRDFQSIKELRVQKPY